MINKEQLEEWLISLPKPRREIVLWVSERGMKDFDKAIKKEVRKRAKIKRPKRGFKDEINRRKANT